MVLVTVPSDGSLRGSLRSRNGREFLVHITAPQTSNSEGHDTDFDAAACTDKRRKVATNGAAKALNKLGPRQLFGDAELLQLLRPHSDLVKLRLEQDGTSAEILEKDLLEIIEHAIRDCEQSHLLNGKEPSPSRTAQTIDRTSSTQLQFCKRVVEDIEALGWDQVMRISEDMRSLDLLVKDEAGREHTLHVNFPSNYPQQPPSLSASVPEAFQQDATRDTSMRDSRNNLTRSNNVHLPGLRGLVAQFQDKLRSFQGAWAELDDLDANTWVLDPVEPNYSIMYRRIALAKHCSMQVRISIEAPRSVCECQFMGSEAALAPFRKRFNRNLRSWNRSAGVRSNLLRVLEISEFPQKDAKEIGEQQECGVCYCVRLPIEDLEVDAEISTRNKNESILPDCICPNPKCSRGFHPACLRDWFQSLPTTRHTFDTMFGTCPYCSGPISVLTG